MQTFLPYADFAKTARVLDAQRLGKQRVETLQIMRALRFPAHGWRNHPVVRMWRGYEEALAAYGLAVCAEWRARGYADTCADKITSELVAMTRRRRVRPQRALAALDLLPPWLGRRAFHASHRSALLRKRPEWYRRFFADVRDDLPYVWPVARADASVQPTPARTRPRGAPAR